MSGVCFVEYYVATPRAMLWAWCFFFSGLPPDAQCMDVPSTKRSEAEEGTGGKKGKAKLKVPEPTCNVPVGCNPLCSLFLYEKTRAALLCSESGRSPSDELAVRVYQETACRSVLSGHKGEVSKAVTNLAAGGGLLTDIHTFYPHLIDVHVRSSSLGTLYKLAWRM